MKCLNKLWQLFVMLCYIYGSLATAYTGTIRSVKHERSTSQFSQRCVLCSRVLPSSFFRGSLARPVSTRTQVIGIKWIKKTCKPLKSLLQIQPYIFDPESDPDDLHNPNDACWWTCSCSRSGWCVRTLFREKCPYKQLRPLWPHTWPKNTFRDVYEPRRSVFGTEILCHTVRPTCLWDFSHV